MPETSTTYVICYDIPDAKRRAQVVRCLQGFGSRVQCSIFEAALPRPLFDNMVCRLREMVLNEDQISIYRVCAACMTASVFLGLADREDRPGRETVFVV
jgi:CRISPR-associated protein Cas2